jgi:MoaA/NifB/PqqE/SkfB family radical SAM enzyme
VFIDPKKHIYPCDISTKKIGQVLNGSFVSVGEAGDAQCANSWMICTARAAIKKHWYKSIKWIIINKFFK